jgi:hypothetical protein
MFLLICFIVVMLFFIITLGVYFEADSGLEKLILLQSSCTAFLIGLFLFCIMLNV